VGVNRLCAYCDKEVVGDGIAFSCAASPAVLLLQQPLTPAPEVKRSISIRPLSSGTGPQPPLTPKLPSHLTGLFGNSAKTSSTCWVIGWESCQRCAMCISRAWSRLGTTCGAFARLGSCHYSGGHCCSCVTALPALHSISIDPCMFYSETWSAASPLNRIPYPPDWSVIKRTTCSA
jgi:hypothetical protein